MKRQSDSAKRAHHMAVNATFNPTIRKPKPPTSSWWTEKDFPAAYAREKDRLMRTDTARVIHPEDPRA
jgi:hypothetical protein